MDNSGKTFVYIFSSMRAGSTLLKALIATRPDASDLPEVSFINLDSIKSNKRIIVIKKPAYYLDSNYPILPTKNSKKIILIRNPYDTIDSLQRMNSITHTHGLPMINDEFMLLYYWYNVYDNILTKFDFNSEDVFLVRYEDLIDNPIKISEEIFRFIGSVDISGTSTYNYPKGYRWKWGSDDGGEVIKGLEVKKIEKARENVRLLELISRTEEVEFLLKKYGYD